VKRRMCEEGRGEEGRREGERFEEDGEKR